jgi:hypothetical protein
MTPERPLPPVSFKSGVLIIVPTVLAAVLLVWLAWRYGTDAWPGLLLLIPIVAGYFYTYRRRCPECGGRLAFRYEFIDRTRYRCLYDCSHCQITWDSGQIGGKSDAS